MQIKTLHIKKCSRCKTIWAAEKFYVDMNTKVEFIETTIAYCPVCAQDFASEIDRPFYERSGKKRNV